jgi:ABC-type polysaccharide/polyol phosphate transport system ATPase subunit
MSNAISAKDNIIEVRNVTVEFDTPVHRYSSFKEYVFNRLRGLKGTTRFRALNNIEFEIPKGESIALIGHNGCGKSTMLRVIAGIYEPEGAHVKVHGRVAPMIELGAGFDPELSGRENIALACTMMGLTPQEIADRTAAIIEFSELGRFIDFPFKNYSSGMQARLGFACATAVDPDVLLVDEILSVGDSNFSEKCLTKIRTLQKNGTTIVLVSHDPETVKNFCSSAMVFDEGNLVYRGPTTLAWHVQNKLQELRLNPSISPESRRESALLTIRELTHHEISSADLAKPVPEADVQYQIIQKGSERDQIDFGTPFSIQLQFSIKNPNLFLDGCIIGFALYSESGIRITGFNNAMSSGPLGLTQIQSAQYFSIAFEFPTGMPSVHGNRYLLVAGIHDGHGARRIYLNTLGTISAINSSITENPYSDLINYNGLVRMSSMDIKN